VLDAPDSLADIQQSFTEALPRIEGLASAYLGFMRRDKDEAIAETVALAWKSYRDLALRGMNVVKLLGKIVEFSARQVRCGRGLTNINPVQEVLSATARFRHGYQVNSLPLSERDDIAPELIEAMRDDTSPADEATFRVDLEEWLSGLDKRRQEIVGQLVSGWNTVEVARLHRISRMRIFQLRRELVDDWQSFQGE